MAGGVRRYSTCSYASPGRISRWGQESGVHRRNLATGRRVSEWAGDDLVIQQEAFLGHLPEASNLSVIPITATARAAQFRLE